jgi:peptidoglycan/LPS O-acetylase OafA/YrhL
MLIAIKYRQDIQILRGLAVAAVVLFHTNQNYFLLGYLGVDVFFVISGFVVTPLILRIFSEQSNEIHHIYSLKKFFISRFYRLAPALASTILISGLIIILLDPFAHQQNLARQGISSLLLLGNFAAYKYSGDYFSPNPNPLVHTWSLSVEEQIYIILPIILTIILRKRSRLFKRSFYVYLSITSISFISFLFPTILNPVYNKLGIEIASQISFYSPLDRVWQFTLGGLVFILATKMKIHDIKAKSRKMLNLFLALALILILFSSFQISQKIGSIIISILTLLIIILSSLEFFPKFLSSKLKWLGDRSYSIYLVHMPIIYIIDQIIKRLIGVGGNTFIQFVISTIAVLFFGALSYSKVESKFRIVSKKENFSMKVKIVSIIATFVLPLTLLLPLALKSGNNMYTDRLDDGICKFWTPILDNTFYSRFQACTLKFGKATIVLGDSHALNIYNTIFLTSKRNFLVGVSKGGCRPKESFSHCPYAEFEKFIKSESDNITQVLFHQSGSYLISDFQGNVDSDLAFSNVQSFKIITSDLYFLSSYLNKLDQLVPTTWIGPFPEARINSTLLEVWARKSKPNPVVKYAFIELENQIFSTLRASDYQINYISLLENLGPQIFQIQIDNCLMFRDKDHWSLCAEKFYSNLFRANAIY